MRNRGARRAHRSRVLREERGWGLGSGCRTGRCPYGSPPRRGPADSGGSGDSAGSAGRGVEGPAPALPSHCSGADTPLRAPPPAPAASALTWASGPPPPRLAPPRVGEPPGHGLAWEAGDGEGGCANTGGICRGDSGGAEVGSPSQRHPRLGRGEPREPRSVCCTPSPHCRARGRGAAPTLHHPLPASPSPRIVTRLHPLQPPGPRVTPALGEGAKGRKEPLGDARIVSPCAGSRLKAPPAPGSGTKPGAVPGPRR